MATLPTYLVCPTCGRPTFPRPGESLLTCSHCGWATPLQDNRLHGPDQSVAMGAYLARRSGKETA